MCKITYGNPSSDSLLGALLLGSSSLSVVSQEDDPPEELSAVTDELFDNVSLLPCKSIVRWVGVLPLISGSVSVLLRVDVLSLVSESLLL